MKWRRKKEETRRDSSTSYDDQMRSRLRGIAELEHPAREDEAAAVEARLRNMVYGTNRE